MKIYSIIISILLATPVLAQSQLVGTYTGEIEGQDQECSFKILKEKNPIFRKAYLIIEAPKFERVYNHESKEFAITGVTTYRLKFSKSERTYNYNTTFKLDDSKVRYETSASVDLRQWEESPYNVSIALNKRGKHTYTRLESFDCIDVKKVD